MICSECCKGAIAPIEATDEMTKPVGIRDGQLFTKPGDTLPEAEPDGALLQVENNEWKPKTTIPNKITQLEDDVDDLDEDITSLENDYNDLEDDIEDIVTRLKAVNGTSTSSLSDLVTELETLKPLIKTAANLIESGILNTDPFSSYSTKITSAYTTIITALNAITKRSTSDTVISSSTAYITNVRNSLKSAINAISPIQLSDDSDFAVFSDSVTAIASTLVQTGYEFSSGKQYPVISDFTMPTVLKDGSPASTTLNCEVGHVWEPFKKITIPSYFVTISQLPVLSTSGYAPEKGINEELVIHGNPTIQNTETIRNASRSYRFHKLVMEDYVGYQNQSIELYCPGVHKTDSLDIPFTVNVPKFIGTIILDMQYESEVQSTGGRTINLTATWAKGYGNENNPTNTRTATGTIQLPHATDFYMATCSVYPLTYYMPSINNFKRWTIPSGVTPTDQHFYFGPNLTYIWSSSELATWSGNGLTIHIPAGDSATKTTLDNANIAYVQDYVI